MLPRAAKSVDCEPGAVVSVGVGGPSTFVMDGDRLWRLIYEAEECERGS